MKIELDFRLKSKIENFGCILKENKLFVTTKLNDLCVQNDIRSVEELLSFMISFPSTTMSHLKLDQNQFEDSLKSLQKCLVGKINESF